MTTIAALAAALLLGQVQVIDQEQVEDATEQKTVALDTSLKELDALRAYLERVEKPVAGNGTQQAQQDYFLRVSRYYKARARAAILLQDYYRRALEQKYALENQIIQFDLYLASRNTKAKRVDEQITTHSADLTRQEREYRNEARLLADSLAAHITRRAGEADPANAGGLKARAERLERFANVQYLPNRPAIEQRLGQAIDLKSEAAVEKALQDRFNRIKLAQFERNYVNRETVDFGGVLDGINKSLIKAKEDAEQILLDPRVMQLEFQASQVAIISKYLRTQLQDLAEAEAFADETQLRLAMLNGLKEHERFQEMIKLLSGDFEPSTDQWAELLAEQDPAALRGESDTTGNGDSAGDGDSTGRGGTTDREGTQPGQ